MLDVGGDVTQGVEVKQNAVAAAVRIVRGVESIKR
jgi:hypothetical protein